MALVLTDYTSYAVVRGLLGVAEEEIPDDIFDTLANTLLQEVTFALEDVNTTVPTVFETIKGITVVDERSVAQQRFFSIVQLYAGYVAANDISQGAVEMFAPLRIGDGKALQLRSKDPYSALRTALMASVILWRKRLVGALQVLDPAAVVADNTRTLIGSASTFIDPVTGA